MGDERTVPPIKPLAVDRRLARGRLAAAQVVLQMRAQLFHARRGEPRRVRQQRRAGDEALVPHQGDAAHHGAERKIHAQQREQNDEVPALKDVVQLQKQNGGVRAGVVLRVVGDLLALRNHRARHGAQRDEQQQKDSKAHGAQKVPDFFHDGLNRKSGFRMIRRITGAVYGTQTARINGFVLFT